MTSTMPLRVGDDLFASAKVAAEASGRSASQQIGYWAKLGRELERSGSISMREIADVLAGARSYDDIDAKAQAVVRAEWNARIEARRSALNLAERFAAEGRSFVEAGPDGGTVRHPAATVPTARKPRVGKAGATTPTAGVKRESPAKRTGSKKTTASSKHR